MTSRLAIAGAAVLMAFAVALGAFGAHALKARFAPDALALWQTAVDYHVWHSLGLLGVGILIAQSRNTRGPKVTAWLFVVGIVLFCGSLYALALGAPRAVGIVTPFGGIAFIVAWLLLAWTALRK